MAVYTEKTFKDGKVLWLPSMNQSSDSISYRNYDALLATTESSLSLVGVYRILSPFIKHGSNKLFSVNEPINELATKFNKPRNRVSQVINSAIKCGMIKINSDGDYYVFNPYIEFRGMLQDFSLLDWFRDSPQFTETSYNEIIQMQLENDMYVDPSHNIYILEHSTPYDYKLYKIGYSNKIANRIRAYLSYNPTIRLVTTFYVNNPKLYESTIHSKYKANYKNEWYNKLMFDQIVNDHNIDLTLNDDM